MERSPGCVCVGWLVRRAVYDVSVLVPWLSVIGLGDTCKQRCRARMRALGVGFRVASGRLCLDEHRRVLHMQVCSSCACGGGEDWEKSNLDGRVESTYTGVNTLAVVQSR